MSLLPIPLLGWARPLSGQSCPRGGGGRRFGVFAIHIPVGYEALSSIRAGFLGGIKQALPRAGRCCTLKPQGFVPWGWKRLRHPPGLALERSSPVLTRRGDPSWRRVPPGGEYRLAAAPLPPRVPIGAGEILSPMESCEGPAPPGRVGEGSPSHAYTLIFCHPLLPGGLPRSSRRWPGREVFLSGG